MTLLGAISRDGGRGQEAASISRIVVAVDHSAASRLAVERAAALAAKLDARLYVLHVAPSFEAPDGQRFADEAEIDSLFELAERTIRGESDSPRSSVAPVVECVRVGRPASSVPGFAEESRADLLVVGTRARSGLDRIVNGSVAEEILRAARRPVLVVSENTPARLPRAPIASRILAAVDYSESAAQATRLAAALALRDRATVDAVHVIDTSIARSAEMASALESEDLRASLISVATANVRRWLDSALTDPTLRARVQPLVKIGKPAQVLAELAASYDLVACGSHGRSALARALVGSTTDTIIGAARCPVLIAPVQQ